MAAPIGAPLSTIVRAAFALMMLTGGGLASGATDADKGGGSFAQCDSDSDCAPSGGRCVSNSSTESCSPDHKPCRCELRRSEEVVRKLAGAEPVNCSNGEVCPDGGSCTDSSSLRQVGDSCPRGDCFCSTVCGHETCGTQADCQLTEACVDVDTLDPYIDEEGECAKCACMQQTGDTDAPWCSFSETTCSCPPIYQAATCSSDRDCPATSQCIDAVGDVPLVADKECPHGACFCSSPCRHMTCTRASSCESPQVCAIAGTADSLKDAEACPAGQYCFCTQATTGPLYAAGCMGALCECPTTTTTVPSTTTPPAATAGVESFMDFGIDRTTMQALILVGVLSVILCACGITLAVKRASAVPRPVREQEARPTIYVVGQAATDKE